METFVRNLGEKTNTNPPHLDGLTPEELSFNVYFSIYFTAGSRECGTVCWHLSACLMSHIQSQTSCLMAPSQAVQMVSLLLI